MDVPHRLPARSFFQGDSALIRFSLVPSGLKHWSFVGFVAVLAALTLVSGCGATTNGRKVLAITMDPSTLTPPTDAQALTTHDAAVRGIAAIFVKDLALPVPDQMTVYVYASRDIFE